MLTSRTYPSNLIKFRERKIQIPPFFLSRLFKKDATFYVYIFFFILKRLNLFSLATFFFCACLGHLPGHWMGHHLCHCLVHHLSQIENRLMHSEGRQTRGCQGCTCICVLSPSTTFLPHPEITYLCAPSLFRLVWRQFTVHILLI